MKDIRINKLELENFKCHKSLTLNFMGENASIYGDNATGKTSIYDALTWLLFGKDSHGNGEKNIEIKPLSADGSVKDHLSETSVEAVLLVDGVIISLRRTLKEVWTNKRGQQEATYDGNTSEYYIDGVPMKKNAFQESVNKLVDEETFKMLTSVTYFSNDISWQERRAVLFKIAEIAEEETLLHSTEQFSEIISSKGFLSVDDYKKKLLAEKRGLVGAKSEIPARISECQKTIEDIEGVDFLSARAKIETLQKKSDDISAQIVAIEHNSAAEKKRIEISEAELELSAIEGENSVFRANQKTTDITALEKTLFELESSKEFKCKNLTTTDAFITDIKKQIDDSRRHWVEVNAEVFNKGNCTVCGQVLPPEQLKNVSNAFEEQKRKRLMDIERVANTYKENLKVAEERSSELRFEISQTEEKIYMLKKDIEAAKLQNQAVKDMPGFAERKKEISEKIEVLSRELADLSCDSFSARQSLVEEREKISKEIIEQTVIVNQESVLKYAEQRISELREEVRNSADKLDKIERLLYLVDEFTRYKTRFIEDSINAFFKIARFRLFREQANGGVEDRCDVVLNGVPYINVNSGSKINLGIDIINTLSRAFGITVPLFIDNAESVTSLESYTGQIIRLIVSEKDKELRISNEN